MVKLKNVLPCVGAQTKNNLVYTLLSYSCLYKAKAVLCLLLLVNMLGSCDTCSSSIVPLGISMEIPNAQLTGVNRGVKVIFSITDLALLGSSQLRITATGHRALDKKGKIEEDLQIGYKNRSGKPQVISAQGGVVGLSELVASQTTETDKKVQVAFDLPVEKVIALQLLFELLDISDGDNTRVIQSIPVEWAIQDIIYHVVREGEDTFLTFERLQGDPKELGQRAINITSAHDNVYFSVDGQLTETATLAQLLPHQQVLVKNQESTPIPLVVAPQKKHPADKSIGPIFSVGISPDKTQLASSTSAAAPLPRDVPSLPKTLPHERDVAEEKIAQFKALAKKEQQKSKKPTKSKKPSATDQAGKGPISQEAIEKKIQVEEFKRRAIAELEKRRDKQLKYQDAAGQAAVQEEFEKAKKAIQEVDEHSINEKKEYYKGFFNGLAHNAVGTKLQDATNESFYRGQQAGLKVSMRGGKIEDKIGTVFIMVGISDIFLSFTTLGLSSIPGIILTILGVWLIGHSTAVDSRAQGNPKP